MALIFALIFSCISSTLISLGLYIVIPDKGAVGLIALGYTTFITPILVLAFVTLQSSP